MIPEAVRIKTEARAPESLLAQMQLIRELEETLLRLFSEGKISGTTHTCIGQEACAVSVVGSLDLQRDIVFSSHRCHGHFVVYSDNPEGLISEIMGRRTGVCGGRGGSQHLHNRNFYSNGVQGGIVPVSTGVALAEKFRRSGAVTVCFLGDGTLGEGVVYEALNIASLWDVPILYVLEHNQYAQSTHTSLTISGDVLARAEAFDIPTDRRAADDPMELASHMSRIVETVRQVGRPFFQVLDTYRLAAHSKGDDTRNPEEIARLRSKDPLIRLQATVGPEATQSSKTVSKWRIAAAVQAAEAAPLATIDPAEEERRLSERYNGASPLHAFAQSGSDQTLVVQNLNAALHAIMTASRDAVIIGEDVLDPYGGAFKVTRGLSTHFPKRVLTTPISEAAIVGIASGLALRGFRPIVEIMFGDFLALCADQIMNHAAKFHWMYNGQVEAPLVIRTPVGGRRGYGPTHSQSIEKMFFGIPGLVVVGISLRHDPGELLRRAVLEDNRPVLFIEQKSIYAKRLQHVPPVGMRFDPAESQQNTLYPTGVWRPFQDADLTIVAYGGMTEIAEQAMLETFDADEILSEYVVPSQLAPLRMEPIIQSVSRTGKLLVVEEGTAPWGFGSEVLARVAEAVHESPVKCARVGAHHLPIPNARSAEELVLPDTERVSRAIRKLVQ